MTSADPHAKDVHEICEFKILWEGNPINLSKTFGTRNCSLCLQEKLQIVRRPRTSTGGDFLNRRSEIEGACRHRMNFHKLQVREDTPVATDERTCLFIDTKIREKVSEAKASMDRYYLRARDLRGQVRNLSLKNYHSRTCFRFRAGF